MFLKKFLEGLQVAALFSLVLASFTSLPTSVYAQQLSEIQPITPTEVVSQESAVTNSETKVEDITSTVSDSVAEIVETPLPVVELETPVSPTEETPVSAESSSVSTVLETETEEISETSVVSSNSSSSLEANPLKETFSPIEAGTSYVYKENVNVSIVFKTLDVNVSNPELVIEKVVLNDGQIGYKFETNMTNGQFTYRMTLPVSSDKVELKYSEDGQNFSAIENYTKSENQLSFESDHFTIFVVTPITDPNPALTCANNGATIGPIQTCYSTIQEAINASSDGDTINIVAGTYNEVLRVDKQVVLTGVSGPVIINAGPMTIAADNVTVNGLTFQGINTHAIVSFNQQADNLTVTNNTFIDINAGNGGGIIMSTNLNPIVGWNISNNTFRNNNNFFDPGVSAINLRRQTGLLIADNIIDGVNRGIQLDWVENVNVIRNTIENTDIHGIQIADVDGPTGNVIVVENTIRNVANRGGVVIYGGPNFNGPIVIADNIIDNTLNGIVTNPGPNPIFDLTNLEVFISGNNISNQTNAGVRHEGNGAFQPLTRNVFSNNILDIDYQSNTNLLALGINWDPTNGNFYDVVDQSSLDQIEAKIRHNCDTSPFDRGTCNGAGADLDTSFASVQYGFQIEPIVTVENVTLVPGQACGIGSAVPNDGIRVTVQNWNANYQIEGRLYRGNPNLLTPWQDLRTIFNQNNQINVDANGTATIFVSNTGGTPAGPGGWEVRVVDNNGNVVTPDPASIVNVDYTISTDLESEVCGFVPQTPPVIGPTPIPTPIITPTPTTNPFVDGQTPENVVRITDTIRTGGTTKAKQDLYFVFAFMTTVFLTCAVSQTWNNEEKLS